jgi:hypothetical protein
MLVWSFSRVSRLFPSYNALCEAFRKHQQPCPTPANVSMWASRNAIPGRWTAPLVTIVHAMGHDPTSLIVEAKEAQAERRADKLARKEAIIARRAQGKLPTADDLFGTPPVDTAQLDLFR